MVDMMIMAAAPAILAPSFAPKPVFADAVVLESAPLSPDSDPASPCTSPAHTPVSPPPSSTTVHLALRRRKSTTPVRSPLRTGGTPGVVLQIPNGGPCRILSLPASESLKSSLATTHGKLIRIAAPTRMPSYVSRLAYTPPASDEEDEATTGGPAKRFKKDKSPPIISRHSGLKKECGACGTKKTPYWRDGWDRTVILCNACGIRFQKYRTRCSSCNYIPRKEEKVAGDCTHCHGSFI